MKDLTVRLDALDPQAGAALRVIAYFDDLLAGGAGLQMIVRAAALLTASPAGLLDDARHVRVRVDARGLAGECPPAPDPAWPSAPVGSGVLWVEHAGPPRPVDAMVLERAATAAASVLDRTRGRRHDPASVETLLDPAATAEARTTAARRLSLPESEPLRAVAFHRGRPAVLRPDDPVPADARAGVGFAVPLAELPASWESARLALRLTAEGAPHDPGLRVVHADAHQALILLARTLTPDTPEPSDVTTLNRAAQSFPWMLATLDALATTPTARSAAALLRIHHSTLQDRLTQAQRLLPYPLATPAGRHRLALALTMRRLHRTP